MTIFAPTIAAVFALSTGITDTPAVEKNLHQYFGEAEIVLAKGPKPITPKFKAAATGKPAKAPKARKPPPVAKKPVTSVKKPFTSAAQGKQPRVFHPKPKSQKGPFTATTQSQPRPVNQPKGTPVAKKVIPPAAKLKSIYNYNAQKKMSYDFSQASKK